MDGSIPGINRRLTTCGQPFAGATIAAEVPLLLVLPLHRTGASSIMGSGNMNQDGPGGGRGSGLASSCVVGRHGVAVAHRKGTGALVPARLILDTDIGTDVDDCLALAVVLGSPEVRLEDVTCVSGDVALRQGWRSSCSGWWANDDVPVMLGGRDPLLRLQPVSWPGHEGKGRPRGRGAD